MNALIGLSNVLVLKQLHVVYFQTRQDAIQMKDNQLGPIIIYINRNLSNEDS